MAENPERSARESALRSGWTVESEDGPGEAPLHLDTLDGRESSVELPETEERGAAQGSQLSNLAVVLLGLTGGLFLLYAWIWLSWAQHYSAVNAAVAAGSGSIGGVLQQIVFWIAPLAPILWFVAALVIHRRNSRRLALLIAIGLIVLVPLPALFSSGAAL